MITVLSEIDYIFTQRITIYWSFFVPFFFFAVLLELFLLIFFSILYFCTLLYA